jgi:Ca2+-binding RTX toxin-like protein
VSDDYIDGGEGNDMLLGQGGNDYLQGGNGNDAIDGGGGVDVCYGGGGDDIIFGGAGGDLIRGGVGADVLKGEAAADLFVFGWNEGADSILDLNAGGARDVIDLRSIFDVNGYAGTRPISDGAMACVQYGSATDIYCYNAFIVRVENVAALALIQDQSYFLYQ